MKFLEMLSTQKGMKSKTYFLSYINGLDKYFTCVSEKAITMQGSSLE